MACQPQDTTGAHSYRGSTGNPEVAGTHEWRAPSPMGQGQSSDHIDTSQHQGPDQLPQQSYGPDQMQGAVGLGSIHLHHKTETETRYYNNTMGQSQRTGNQQLGEHEGCGNEDVRGGQTKYTDGATGCQVNILYFLSFCILYKNIYK